MIQFHAPEDATVRRLTASEQRILQGAVSSRRKTLQTLSARTLKSSILIFGFLWLATLLASRLATQKDPWWVITIIWLVVGSIVWLWGYIPERRRLTSDLEKFERAAARDEAIVVQIRSERMVEFEEEEDEGACYAFQLQDGRIRFVQGQDFYRSAKFPNTDFSLVHIVSDDGRLLEQQIAKHGDKLEPIHKIPAEIKSKLKIPDHLAIIHGDVNDLEQLLS